MRSIFTTGIFLSLLIGFPAASHAASTIIDFDNLVGFIPTTYGSNAVNTPNVGVSYRSVGPTIRNFLNLSVADYGDLINVAQPVSEFDRAEIKFTPTSGASITLESFDLAGWPMTDYTADILDIVDTNNTVLWSPGSLNVAGAGPSHTAYSVNLTSSVPIILRFGNTYNLGIDNIKISQTAAAPEPGTLALLALGGVGLIFRKRSLR